MVPLTGLEPVRSFERGILSPLRLPIPPQRQGDRWRSVGVFTPKSYRYLVIIANAEENVNDFPAHAKYFMKTFFCAAAQPPIRRATANTPRNRKSAAQPQIRRAARAYHFAYPPGANALWQTVYGKYLYAKNSAKS